MSEELFSTTLSAALNACGLSQSEVAKRAGITAPYLSDLKNGKRKNPSPEVIKKLASVLSVNPAQLIEINFVSQRNSDSALSTNAKSSTYPKQSDSAFSDSLQEEGSEYVALKRYIPDSEMEQLICKFAQTHNLESLQRRIIELGAEAAEGDVAAAKLISYLGPIVARRMHHNHHSTEP